MARIPPKDGVERRQDGARHHRAGSQRVVFGQDEAIKVLCRPRSKLSRAGLRDPRQADRQLFCSGPTGRGKTEVARQLSKRSAFRCNALICRNIWSGTPVSRLIGAPPGYVGYDQGGSADRRDRPEPAFAVLLLDEIEKAIRTCSTYCCR